MSMCVWVHDYVFVQACVSPSVCVCGISHMTQHIPPRCLTLVSSLTVWCVSLSQALTFCCFCRQRAVFCHPLIRKETNVAHKAAVSLMASCVNVLPERRALSRGDLGVNGEGGTGESRRMRQCKHSVVTRRRVLNKCRAPGTLSALFFMPVPS